MSGIADLGKWLQDQLGQSQVPSILDMFNNQPKRPPTIHETINPNVPLPTYSPRSDGGYDVQNLPEGSSTFAPYGPLMMKNPGRGLVRFDPTGTYNDQNLPPNMNNFLLVPMAESQFKPLPYLQPIGGR